MALQLFDIN